MFKKSMIVLAILAVVAVFSVPREARSAAAAEFALLMAIPASGASPVECAEDSEVLIRNAGGCSGVTLFPCVSVGTQDAREFYEAAEEELFIEFGLTGNVVAVPIAAIGALTAQGGSVSYELDCAALLSP